MSLGTTVPPLVTRAKIRRRNRRAQYIAIGSVVLLLLILVIAWSKAGNLDASGHTTPKGLEASSNPSPAPNPFKASTQTTGQTTGQANSTTSGQTATSTPTTGPTDARKELDDRVAEDQRRAEEDRRRVAESQRILDESRKSWTPDPDRAVSNDTGSTGRKTLAQAVADDRAAAMESSGYPGQAQADKGSQTPPPQSASPWLSAPGYHPETVSNDTGRIPMNPLLAEPSRLSPSDFERQNDQNEKQAFLGKQDANAPILAVHRTPPKVEGTCIVRRGWSIPAQLVASVGSDLPGSVRARVRAAVYGSDRGDCLAIPQNSILIGHYNSNISYGQERAQVLWDTLICRNARGDGYEEPIDLHGMQGNAPDGTAGLKGHADHHYKKLVGWMLLSSVFAAGIQIATNPSATNASGTYGPSYGSSAAQGVGISVGEQSRKITERNLNQQNTLSLPLGLWFEINPPRDLVFLTEEEGTR